MRRDCRHLAQGAMRQGDGSVVWRIWAPSSADVSLVAWPGGERQEVKMAAEGDGCFVHRQPSGDEGLRYAYQLSDGGEYPDPASRWQPEGVHCPSALFSPESCAWWGSAWRGIAREDLVIYELQVGAFTPEGTLDAIVPSG